MTHFTLAALNSHLNSPLLIGSLSMKNRLIQGPLAGYSCAPFRELFSQFTPPAYSVSEMLSAQDVLTKHRPHERYLYRGKNEKILCYQLAGTDPKLMASAATKLVEIHADLIDINCGCPKPKIRKKGAGSALLENQSQLIKIVSAIRQAIKCPLTVKIRLQGSEKDIQLAKAIAEEGADALIIHGRRWTDDYARPCDYQQIAAIKQTIDIPVIANGDIHDLTSLHHAWRETQCDGFMISRASTGKPWLFQELLTQKTTPLNHATSLSMFMTHLQGLAKLETEYQAVLQSKSLVHYYFKNQLNNEFFSLYYQLKNLHDIENALISHLPMIQYTRDRSKC